MGIIVIVSFYGHEKLQWWERSKLNFQEDVSIVDDLKDLDKIVCALVFWNILVIISIHN